MLDELKKVLGDAMQMEKLAEGTLFYQGLVRSILIWFFSIISLSLTKKWNFFAGVGPFNPLASALAEMNIFGVAFLVYG